MTGTMRVLKAHVEGGRLVANEPSRLPEGTETEIIAFDDDDFEPEERARLLQAIEEGAESIERGEAVDGIEFANELLARREAQTR
jgi:hypothetical protein